MSSLLLTRRFAPLFWCQFFSAFSDNFLKNALVFLLLFKIGGPDAEALITLAAAVFISPYFFLSALGGEFAIETGNGRGTCVRIVIPLPLPLSPQSGGSAQTVDCANGSL